MNPAVCEKPFRRLTAFEG